MRIRIIIPCYNEEKRVGRTIFQTMGYLDNIAGLKYNILAVNDGSTDKTEIVLKTLSEAFRRKVSYVSYGVNRGKGYAVRYGMLLSGQYDWLVFMDADGSSHISNIIPFLKRCKEDIVITDRELDGSKVSDVSVVRWISTNIFYLLRLAVLGLTVMDTQNGLKAFKQKVAKDIFTVAIIDRFSFDVEILYLAKKLGYAVKSVPVTWINDKYDSRVRLVADSWQMLKDLFRIQWLYAKDAHLKA
jgi:dolichyl-phosphate beta-glucosyltransferase